MDNFNMFNPPGYNMNNFNQSMPKINTNKIIVNSIDDVRNMNIPANSDYICQDASEPIVYRITVDKLGKKEVKAYSLTELDISNVNSQFVDKKDFNKLLEQISNQNEAIQKLTEQVNKHGGT